MATTRRKKRERSRAGQMTVLAVSASMLLVGCAGGGSSENADLRKQVDDLEAQVSALQTTSTTSPGPATTTASMTTTAVPTTTTAPAPYGGLVASLPEGDTSNFADWSFPLPGPSTVTTPLQLNTDGPYDAEYFTATISDPGVGFEDLQAFLRAVPAAQGWDGNFELPSGESSHSLGSWSFFSPDGLFIYLDIVDAPVAEGKLSAPAMVVTFTYTDG